MNTEITSTGVQFAAPAIAIGALCGIAAVLLLFPLIDRFIRPRFRLERGSALLLLLLAGLIFTVGGSFASFFVLRRNAENVENLPESKLSSRSILDASHSFRKFS